jgi:N-glycosylase/DNA lyase
MSEKTAVELANAECALWQEQSRANEKRIRQHERLILRIHKWLENGGEEQIRRAMEEAEKASEEIRKAYQVDPATMHEPCTI